MDMDIWPLLAREPSDDDEPQPFPEHLKARARELGYTFPEDEKPKPEG